MGISDLKVRMHDVPGIETLTMTMAAGQQKFVLNGRTISFSAGDSDAAVEAGIRAAVASPAIVQMATGTTTPDTAAAAAVALHPTIAAQIAPSVSLLPSVSPTMTTPAPVAAPTVAPTATPTAPAAHALTIKDALADHAQKLDQILQAQFVILRSALDDQINTVQGGTDAVISGVKSHTDEFKAILGQFSNQLGKL
jgi:hypothetical protein